MILRTGTAEEIQTLYNRLGNDVKLLIQSTVQMVYFMRGSISYETALYGMNFIEREITSDYITKRLKDESKSINPVY